MNQNRALDEREIEAILGGHVPADRPDLEPLARFVRTARADVGGPVPAPNAALATLLASGLPHGVGADPHPGRAAGVAVAAGRHRGPVPAWQRNLVFRAFAGAAARAAGFGFAMKMGSVTFVAVAAVAGAGAAGALPDPVQAAVANSVETVTPFSIPRPDDPTGPGDNGVGDEVRDKARQQGQDGTGTGGDRTGTGGPTQPGSQPTAPGEDGLDQANDGPAAPNVPDQVPSGRPTDKPGKGLGHSKDRSTGRDAGVEPGQG